MKKFILCACCVFLSGAAAQALAFRNDSDVVVNLGISYKPLDPTQPPFEMQPNQRISRIDVALSSVTWFRKGAHNRNPIAKCDFVSENQPISLKSGKTIVFKGKMSVVPYACVLE